MLLVEGEEVLLDANLEACNILGYEKDELLRLGLRDVVDTSDPRSETLFEGRWTGKQRGCDLHLLRRGGVSFVAKVSFVRFVDVSGDNVLGLIFQKRVEDGVSQRGRDEGTQLGEALVKNSSDLITLCNADNTIRFVSPSVERILGYKPDELLGVFVPSLIHPDDLALAVREAERIVQESERRPPPVRYRHKNGSWVFLESITNNLLGDPGIQGIVVNSREVTERVGAEEEIRRLNEDLGRQVELRTAQLKAAMAEADDSAEMMRLSEERFRTLVRHASDMIAVLDAGGTILYESPAVERVLGFEPGQRIGTNTFDHLHPEDVGAVRNRFAELLSKPDERLSVEYRILDKEGSWRYFEAIGTNVLDNPIIGGIIVNARDITERRRAEEVLRESEELYRTVVEQAAENIFIVDVNTRRILEANAAFYDSLGYTPGELQAMTLYDIVAHDRESIDRNIQRIVQDGQRSIGERQYRRKDGSLMGVEVNVSALSYGGREAMCIVAHDVTERKRAEGDLRRSLSVLLALREAGQVLGSTLESEEIISRLLEIMRRVSSLTAAVISVQDDGRLRIKRSAGLKELWHRARFTPEAEATRWAVMQDEEQRLFRLRYPDSASKSLVALYLPLKAKDRVVGVLEAYGPESLAENDTVEILGSLASQAASALENARLYEALEERERRLQDLVGKLLGAQEEERRHVAYEVHDELAQVAVAAHQHLQAFAERHVPTAERGQRDLERILRLVRGTVSGARRIIANLRPTTLDDLGLAATISLEVERLREEGYQVEYREELGDGRLPDQVEIALFRVAHEALTNMRKHARTGQVHIELGRLEDEVYLKIQDYGRGFDPTKASIESGPGERVGLAGMRERVGILGGELKIHSQPGVGTCVIATIPLVKALQ
jgi:PAS domain S-box-containing protein